MQAEPYILESGTMQEADQTFLVIDRQIVTEVPLESTVLSLMASSFVFNVCYPRGVVIYVSRK